MRTPRAQWARATDFAEVAEALGIATDHLMARLDDPSGVVTAMYSTHVDDEAAAVRIAALTRDPDGILRVRSDRDTGFTVGDYLPPKL
jgi:hypothetical protein